MYVKLGLQFRYAVEQFNSPFSKIIFAYAVELSCSIVLAFGCLFQ